MINSIAKTTGFETLTAPNRNGNRNERTDGRSFDSFLATPQRDNALRQPERPARSDRQRENRENSRNIEAASQTMMNQGQGQTTQIVTGDEMVSVTIESNQALPADESAELSLESLGIALDLLEDEVLAEIAAVLGIMPQVLTEILNALGMTLSDLQDNQAQTELLQMMHGLDDEVALLNLPATLPIMQEISNTMEKYAPVLLEYQEKVQNQTQYAVIEEVMPENLDMDAQADAETVPSVPTVRIVRDDTPKADLPIDYDAIEAVATVAGAGENTVQTNAESQQSIEPIMAFAQATEQPIDSFVRPVPVADVMPQAPVNPKNVMEQIVQNMRFEVRGDMAEIRIQLRPEHLGEVSLRVATQNGIVVAQFVAESQRVKEIIESNFNQLRDALEQQGINISEIEVSVAQDEADRQFAFESNISGDRIRDIMEAAEEDEAAKEIGLEENIVDYLA